MKAGICTIILLIICILVCGCTGETPALSGTKNPAGETPEVPATPATAAGSVPATLSDHDPNTLLSLDPGVIVVSYRAQDVREMQIVLLTKGTARPDNYTAPEAFQMTGAFDGSIAIRVQEKGEYWLNITSYGGPWTADISCLSSDTPMTIPLNFSGSGMMVTPVFFLEKGQYIFDRNVTGISAPGYYLYYGNGTPLMDANNTRSQPGFDGDSPQPFHIVSIPESGNYFLQVFSEKNPNPWSVSVVRLPDIPLPLGPGPVILPLGTTSRP